MKSKSALRHFLFGSASFIAATSLHAQTTYYWNQNGVTAGWGAGGAWNTSSAFFSTINDPTAAAAAATTSTLDTLNIGTATDGFAGGTLTLAAPGQSIGTIITGSANTTAAAIIDTQTLTFAATGTITNNSSQELVFGSVIAGAATRLDLNATGGITLATFANTYTGITFVNSGTVTVNNNGALGSVSGNSNANRTVIASGARINFNNTPRTYNEFFEIAGAGVGGTSGALNNGQTTTLNGLVSLSGAATIANSATLTLGGGISIGANALTFLSGGTTTVQTTGISGTGGSLVKTGGGTLNLSATNTYDGGSTISGGALFFLNTNAKAGTGIHAFAANTTLGLGVATAGAFFTGTDITNAFAGGVMPGNLSNVTVTDTTNVGIDTTPGNFTYSGSVSGSPTKALIKTGAPTLTLDGVNTYTGATSILVGQLTLNGLLTGGTAISTSGSSTFFQSGTGVISGASSYTQNSSGTSTLFGNNSYSVGTTVSAGTLRINSATAIGTGALNLSGGTIDNNSGGVVTLSNNNVFNFTANTTYTGTNSLSNGTGDFTINGTRTITVTANRLTLGGNQTTVIAGGIVKAGAGTLALLGSGVQTGAATVSGGILEVGVMTNGSLASSVGNTSNAAANLKLNNGTTLRYVGSTDAVTDRAFTIDSGTVGHGATIESSGIGTFSFSGGPAIAYGTGGQTRFLTLGGTNTGANTFGKVIADNGAGATSLTKTGAGTWVINQTNTYAGATTITGGTLKLGANNVLPNTLTSTVSIGTATLDADTRTETAGTLDATGTATINLGTGAALAFANSSGVTSGVWAGALNITGTFVPGNGVDPGAGVNPGSIRFGVNATGLTASQLADITVNGSGTYALDAFGYLVAGGGNTYATWIGANGPATGFETDSDNDGIPNGVENVLGSNPNTYNAGLTEVSSTANSVVFKHTLNPTVASDVTYSYEWSTDMVEWKASTQTNTGGTTATIAPSAPALGVVTVTITITGGPSAKLFGRLIAVKP